MPMDESACGIPVSMQIENLNHELADRGLGDVSVMSVDLSELAEDEREAAVDALVAGLPSPFVVLGDRLICSGLVDVPAIIEALG
jgi:hypothetical protein